MKKSLILLACFALLACTALFSAYAGNQKSASASKPENIQELLQNFNPGDEMVAYADSLNPRS